MPREHNSCHRKNDGHHYHDYCPYHLFSSRYDRHRDRHRRPHRRQSFPTRLQRTLMPIYSPSCSGCIGSTLSSLPPSTSPCAGNSERPFINHQSCTITTRTMGSRAMYGLSASCYSSCCAGRYPLTAQSRVINASSTSLAVVCEQYSRRGRFTSSLTTLWTCSRAFCVRRVIASLCSISGPTLGLLGCGGRPATSWLDAKPSQLDCARVLICTHSRERGVEGSRGRERER